MDFLVLSLSDFFDLVVVDVELLSIEGFLMKVSLGLGSIFWLLKADKCIN